MASIDVCLSPHLLPLYQLEGKLVIVVDVLRATSCMVTAIAHGIDHIIPFNNVADCAAMRQHGYLTAGERDGRQVEGFDFGNSPFSFMDANLDRKKLAVTTTNGTECIKKSEAAASIVIGAFLNIDTVANYILSTNSDVVIACSAWKGKPNAEDTLFAGALVAQLPTWNPESDNCLLAETLWHAAKSNPLAFIEQTTHVQRLHRLAIVEDIAYCLKQNTYPVLPIIKEGRIVKG